VRNPAIAIAAETSMIRIIPCVRNREAPGRSDLPRACEVSVVTPVAIPPAMKRSSIATGKTYPIAASGRVPRRATNQVSARL